MLHICYLAGLFQVCLAIVAAITIGALLTLWLFYRSPDPQYLQPRHIIHLVGFKTVNDSCRSAAGDEILEAVAEHSDRATALHATDVSEKIGAAIRQPVQSDGMDLRVGVSVRIVPSDQTTKPVESICASSKQAMYRAKSRRDMAVGLHDSKNEEPQVTPGLKAANVAVVQKRENTGSAGP